MRSKTFVLGILAAFVLLGLSFLSAKVQLGTPDIGYNPGERLPSIKVDDVNLQDLGHDKPVLVVLWSHSDAQSRMVNAWMSKQHGDSTILSLCVDASTEDAKYYALIDGLSPDIKVIGAEKNKQLIQKLNLSKSLRIFSISDGVISEATTPAREWVKIVS